MSDQASQDEGIWPNDVLARGTSLNGYRIVRLLGRGGFGVTYLVEDALGQLFALKEYFPRQFAVRHGTQVHAATGEDAKVFDDCRSRFVYEARALVGLGRTRANHDIVRVQTFFEANGTAYMVMEYIVGRTLQATLRDHPGGMPEEDVRRILCGTLAGLAVVHEAGIMHRDIKPANILLRDGIHPVLIDFGSSREASSQQTQGFTQIFSGGYAPPEQILGTRQGPFSDLYAVGVVGYEAIGGKVTDAVTRQHAASTRAPNPMPPASQRGAGRYDPALLAVIDAALALDPNDRPASADAMARMVREAHTPDPPASRPAPPAAPSAAPPPKAAPARPAPPTSAPASAPKPASARPRWPIYAAAGTATAVAAAAALWFLLPGLLPVPAPRTADAQPPPGLPIPAQPGTARPAPPIPPPPRAVATQADGLGPLRTAAAALPCALLSLSQGTGNVVTIAGRARQDAALDGFLAQVRGAGLPVQITTEPLDPGLCAPIPALAAPLRQAQDTAPLRLTLVNGPIVAGGAFAAMLQGTGGGMLQVDLHAADGTVHHVMRRPLPSGQWSNRLPITAAPVAGQQLLVAIASAAALDLGQRPAQERAEDYLPVLRRELERAAQAQATAPRAAAIVLQATAP